MRLPSFTVLLAFFFLFLCQDPNAASPTQGSNHSEPSQPLYSQGIQVFSRTLLWTPQRKAIYCCCCGWTQGYIIATTQRQPSITTCHQTSRVSHTTKKQLHPQSVRTTIRA